AHLHPYTFPTRRSSDLDILKQIEAQHPDIVFDWSAVFQNQQVIETAPEQRRPRKRPETEVPPETPPAQLPPAPRFTVPGSIEGRSEEHTSELQSPYDLV